MTVFHRTDVTLHSAPDRAAAASARSDARRAAVVDLGSNSVRLVVFEGLGRNPVAVFNEKAVLRLGRGLEASGRLNEEAVVQALQVMQRYNAIARAMGADPFEVLATAAVRDASNGPDFVAELQTRMPGVPIRILSAACSTGQEAYSTAIVLKELLRDFRGYDIRIMGLDISDAAVAQASYAHFSRMELDRGMAPDKLARYFEPVGDRWKVRDELRATATFRCANLLKPIASPAPFDIIFCRNVAIYFTEPDRIRLFRNLGRTLARDGALIIGATESITGLCPEFEPKRYLRAVFYQKRE